jgi:hypothetical protein
MKIACYLVFLWLASITSNSFAQVFYSKNEAMELAFGKDAEIELLSLFPDDNESQQIQQASRAKLESGLFTFYVGKSQGKLISYAAIETETVRTKPETLMIVLSPKGDLQKILTLAFHEPPEYRPPENWFKRLYNRPLADMDFNKGVDGISGATLSARSALTSVRKVMSFYQVMIKDKDNH